MIKLTEKKIQRSINTCNRAKLFINLTINEIVELLSDTLINIFRNYISNKRVKFKYGEISWININIKSALYKRTRLTKRYYVNVRMQNDDNLLLSHYNKCTEMILGANNENMLRISKKLNDPSSALNSYWSHRNWFLSNKRYQVILQSFKTVKFNHNPKRRPVYLNDFASQFTLVSNSSVLPDISFHTLA